MKSIRSFYSLSILIIILFGCTSLLNSNHQTVLLPGKEHSYAAELVELPGSYKANGEQEPLEISGLKLEVPKSWRYEKNVLRPEDEIFHRSKSVLQAAFWGRQQKGQKFLV